jgi:hypothetical protein
MLRSVFSPVPMVPVLPFLVDADPDFPKPDLPRPMPVNLTSDEIRAIVNDVLG